MLLIIEREDDSRNPLHHDTEEKRYRDTHEYGDDYAKSLVCIEQVSVAQRAVAYHLYGGKHKRSAQQLEHERHGGGCRHAQSVEHVEDYHVRHHHRKEYGHHLVER